MKYTIGVDLGGTNVVAGIVTDNYEIQDKISFPTRAERPWDQVVEDIAVNIRELVRRGGLELSECAGVGVGCPGTCCQETGEVLYSNNIHWEHAPLGKTLEEKLGVPCRISNDANCAVLGEAAAGAAKGCRNVVLLTLGTGVGAGLLINGAVYEGEGGAGAEMGHSVLVINGIECTCGRKGCIECYVSATGLIRQGEEAAQAHPQSSLALDRPLNAKKIYDAFDAGDETAATVIHQYERYLAEAVVDAVNTFRPQMVLIGGGVSGQGAKLTDPVNQFVRENCFGKEFTFIPEVRTAILGNDAGVIGAAALILGLDGGNRQPFLLNAAYTDYLWGGSLLKEKYNKKTDLSPLAESWELSCHPAGLSVIASGPDAGTTLAAWLNAHPAALGTSCKPKELPILIKLIDAAKPLSIQVHPDDEYALRTEGELGKTEMWYVVDCEPGATLYYGLRQTVSKAELEQHIKDNTLTDILNEVTVKPGDVFFIEPGTLHAIGAGILIAEIQENSNITYRVYDYGRVGADGKLRELHLDKALEVSDLNAVKPSPAPKSVSIQGDRISALQLAQCGYFTTTLLELQTGFAALNATANSFHSLLCVEGTAYVTGGDAPLTLTPGSSAFIPAGFGGYTLLGNGKVILTTL